MEDKQNMGVMSFLTIRQFFGTFVLVVVLAYLLTPDFGEARGLEGRQNEFLDYNQQENLQQSQQQAASQVSPAQQAYEAQQLARLDSDEDDDDDDLGQQLQQDLQEQQQPAAAVQQVAAGSDLYNQADQSFQQAPRAASAQDLRVAASKHYGHHKHGAKGWLDMGAWTGKKGAFGWYDKHPVGKGRK